MLNPWRYFQRRRENEAMRREETTRLAGIRRAERKEERARLRRAVLSGALGASLLLPESCGEGVDRIADPTS